MASEANAEDARSAGELFEHSVAGHFITQLTGEVLVNSAFCEMLGYTLADAKGVTWAEVTQRAGFDTLLSGERTRVRVEKRFLHKDGSGVWVAQSTTLRRDAQGKPLYFITTTVDITQRKRLEEELRHAQKLEGIGRLVGGIAHDFNNLLTVILGFTSSIKDAAQEIEVHSEGAIIDSVSEIERAAHSAVALTRQLLTYSRRRVPRAEQVDLNVAVGSFQKLLMRVLGEDVSICLNLAPTPAPVTLDVSGMDQILMNLAVNSRDAMPRGGTFTLETENLAGWVMMRVSDTGHGMPLDVQQRIFEPLFTTKESGKGTGLGLSTVFGIVNQAGGHVEVTSEVGRGTTFTFWFPRATDVGAPVVVSKKDSGVRKGSATVLVVDDSEPIRKALRSALEMSGYLVLDAECGADALLLCQSHVGNIDLLVIDVVMPGMNGRELLSQFKQLRPDAGALFMTGFPDEVLANYGVLTSGPEVLQKPFTPLVLMQKVKAALRGSARAATPLS